MTPTYDGYIHTFERFVKTIMGLNMTDQATQLNLPQPIVPIGAAFTPHAPIKVRDLLTGRTDLIWQALDAIGASGEHVVLYGDRGVGKTSLARVVGLLAEDPAPDGMRVLYVSCNSSDTFSSIWQRVFQEVQVTERQAVFGGGLHPPEPMTADIREPNDVRLLVRTFRNPVVIVLDEFDRVPTDNDARSLMADTIKLFSDNAMQSKIMLIGVARSVEELIAAHGSVPRHAAQIEVKPMTQDALAEIIQRGFAMSGMTFDDGLDRRIAHLSQGYPHYTHLLGLWSGRRASVAKRTHVNLDDLDAAIPEALKNVIAGVRQQYEKAVQSAQPRTLYKDVLLACAIADKDALGKFPTAAVRQPLSKIMGKPYGIAAFQSHLAKFTEADHGSVLIRTGRERGYRWQFADPQLVPYVLIEGVRQGRIAA